MSNDKEKNMGKDKHVDGYEVIFVMVDRLSKYEHFVPLKHSYTTKGVAEVFVKGDSTIRWVSKIYSLE